MESILEVDFSMEAGKVKDPVYRILETLRPNWKKEDVEISVSTKDD